MDVRKTKLKLALGAGCALAVLAAASTTRAQERTFNLASSRATDSIPEFAKQAGLQIVAPAEKLRGVSTPAIEGRYDAREALALLIAGTGLQIASDDGRTITLAQSPQSGSASDGAEGTVEALIVTAQKREEDIQDVPIAMSAFTQEALTTHQIAGGPDLMTQIPNFTFTKTNFTGYSIQIRGIGTQAVSATVDPAVAIAFNNTPFIRNRFFEQEFYDLNRVEVLRGPQGTLYGRNATAGVVNLITARPADVFQARLSADVSNYSSSRLEGMVNLPLVDDRVSLRLAGAWTKRDGYVTNDISGNQIDGRNLWSVRATLGFEPTDAVRAYLTFEHFEEDDDRLRSGKQLCKRDPNRTHFGDQPVGNDGTDGGAFGVLTYTSQGCLPGSLYSDEAFQVPNGYALPYYGPPANLGLPVNTHIDPYASTTQSKDLRVIESTVDPVYQAKTDIVHLALEFDLSENLTLSSETGYTADELFSFQDFNRFNTSEGIFETTGFSGPSYVANGRLSPEGVFCDPQLGCASRLVAADVSTARSDQFSHEFRLSSSFDGPFNFHLGANFLRYDTMDKYYVFINSLTLWAVSGSVPWTPGVSDNSNCMLSFVEIDPNDPSFRGCMYIDPNPISSLNDNGRQYFLSKNPFRLISYAAFGEVVYNFTPDLKFTGGLRFTVDKKHAPIIPSWLLSGGGYGTPVKTIVEQEWREPTGRAVLDWKPDIAFTDETLLYGSYAHGYKAGGTNPPQPGGLPLGEAYDRGNPLGAIEALQPPEFGPEFIDAFEIGTKNTLLDGRMTLNGDVFYYDYEGYQISQIVNRSALNLNFDAEVWGAELEVDWRPVENLKLSFKGGWEQTRVGDGQSAVDMIDRTAGDPNWAVIKPFPTVPSNCILPIYVLEYAMITRGKWFFIDDQPCTGAYLQGYDPITLLPYVPNPTVRRTTGDTIEAIPPGYAGFDPTTAPNNGWGISKDLSGNELPNAPEFTLTISGDYTLPLPNDWLVTLHGDFYRQSEAWTRIYNMEPYDRLKPFSQVNLAAIFTNEDAGWKIMAYVKNALDQDNITGAFLNSDDTGLTTNVFLNEPRLYGLRVTKQWTGDPWWIGGRRHAVGEPFPFTLEFGGGVQQLSGDAAHYSPAFVNLFNSPPETVEGEVPEFPLGIQDQDLDWGDGREIKLTWRPNSGPWSASLAGRFGRANSWFSAQNLTPSPDSLLGPPQYQTFFICPGEGRSDVPPNHPEGRSCVIEGPDRWALSSGADREEYTLVDFTVGRDFGFGSTRGELSAGLRHARFESTSRIYENGTPDYQLPDNFTLLNPLDITIYSGTFEAERTFEGTGPTFAVEFGAPLVGDDDRGVLDLTGDLTAGMLFGKQETSITTDEEADHYHFTWGVNGPESGPRPGRVAALSYDNPPVTVSRSRDVNVPVVGASVGLAYSIDRVRIGAGYRWERFYNAVDGGVDEQEDADRTIDGPYFKLSVGFGG